ncbi:MAG: dTDP-4-dehydrorhamnose reductase [Deltaproteobacteria bacterium]|nr:dTDP-4-dehydrorhamnose reductase [Deltaproteobacteria bacterium]
MPEPRILLIGQGQLGTALAGILPLKGRVDIWGRKEADLASPRSLPKLLDGIKPDFIFNTAAYTRIDAAEKEEDLVFRINALSPQLLAEWAAANGAALIHYSTDYVFDGEKKGAYLETDQPNPLNVYGRSKLAADEAILGLAGKCYVFRTSWVYSFYGSNFPKTILKLARTKDSLEVVSDQVGAPTSADFLALASFSAVFGGPREYGLYNLTAGGQVSWHELAQYLVREAAKRSWPHKLNPENIRPVTGQLPAYPARRPHNSVLDNSRFRQVFGVSQPLWSFHMERFLDLLEIKRPWD